MGVAGGFQNASHGSGREMRLRWLSATGGILSSATLQASTVESPTQFASGWLSLLSWALGVAALLLMGASLGIAIQGRNSKKKYGLPDLKGQTPGKNSSGISLDPYDWKNLWAENGKDALYIHDREGRILHFIAPELCGIEQEDAVGRLPDDIYPAPQAQAIASRVQQVVTSGRPLRTNFSETWRGMEHSFTEFATPVLGEAGEVAAVVRYCRNLTNLRDAEAIGLQATQTLQVLLANLPGMAYRFRLTPGWPCDFLSEGTSALTGYLPSHFMGPHPVRFQEIILPEDRERRSQGIERAVRDGRSFRMTYRIRTASGQTRWLLDQGRALPGPDGAAATVEGFRVDITSRVAAEEALRHSERDYRLLVENQSEFLVKLDGQGRFLFFSPSFRDFLGRPEEEILETDFFSICQEEFKPDVHAALQQLQEPPFTTHIDHRATTRNGPRWLAWSFRGVLDSDGRVGEAVGVGRDVTAQRAISEALTESESRFRTIVETAPICVKLLDREGRILQMNPVGLEMIEAPSLEVVLGRQASDLVSEDDREAFNEMVAAVFNGETRRLTFAVIGLRGGRRTLESVCVPVQSHGESGPVDALLGATQDITDRLAVEEHLRESESRYRRIFDGVNDGIYLSSVEGKPLLVNPALIRILGFDSQEELLTRDIAREGYPYPEERASFAEIIERDGQVTGFESHWFKKDGSVATVIENSRGIRGRDGRIAFYEGTVRDITGERKSQAALKESEARYRALFDHSSDAIFLADPDTGMLLDANKRAQELIGRDLDEILGMNQLDIHPSEDQELYQAIFKAHSLGEEGPVIPCMLVQHRDGHRVPVDISGSAFRAGERRIQMGVFHDITDRRRNEEAILRERDFSVTALNSLPAIFYVLDTAGSFLRWNHALEQVGEYSAEEIGHMHPLEFFEGADKTLIAERIFQVFSQGNATVEAALVSKSGKRTPFFFNAKKIQLDGQDCLIGTGLDITERKRAEEALRESKSRLQKILEQSPIAMALIGMDGVIEFINEKAVETFGYLQEEIPNMDDWWALACPDEAYRREAVSTWTGLCGDALANNREIGGREYKVTCKDHTVKTVFIFGVPIADKVFVMFQDVTVRNEALEEVMRVTGRLKHLLSVTPTILYTCKPGGDSATTFISANVSSVLGLQASDFTSDPAFWTSRIHPDDAPRVLTDLPKIFEAGVLSHRYRFLDGKSVWRWMQDDLRLLRDDSGLPVEIAGSWTDVTDLVNAEEEVLRQNRQLSAILASSGAMTGLLDLASKTRKLCEATLRAFGFELVWIGLVVPESTELHVLASAGHDEGYTAQAHVRWDDSPRAMGPAGVCIKIRQPVISSVDDLSFAPWREAALARGFRTICGIPLIHEDAVRGAIVLYSAADDTFTPKTLETLQVFARHCAMVIVNAALYEEAKRTIQELLDRPSTS